MPELTPTLERARDRFAAPEMPLENVLRRRDRKRRNQRVAAGAVGIAVGLVAVVIAGVTIRTGRVTPADQTPTPSASIEPSLQPILAPSENLVYSDQGIMAVDRNTHEQRMLAACNTPCTLINTYGVSADRVWLAYEKWTCVVSPPCEEDAGLWVTNTLGEQRQLSHACDQPNSCHTEQWSWSPHGASLVVAEGGNVSTIDPSTGQSTRIAGSSSNVSALAWSPDGSSIAASFDPPSRELEVIDASSGTSSVLTNDVGQVTTMAWSPDGTRLVFDQFKDGDDQIVLVNADGSGEHVLVDQGAPQGPGAPAWSPDGTRIAYVTTPEQPNVSGGHFWFQVWTIGADGSNPLRLFSGDCCIGEWDGPVWSPDGSQIAFFDDKDVSYGTWLVTNADGTGSAEQIPEAEVQTWQGQ
jgi:Tol biopolymer transport system component